MRPIYSPRPSSWHVACFQKHNKYKTRIEDGGKFRMEENCGSAGEIIFDDRRANATLGGGWVCV